MYFKTNVTEELIGELLFVDQSTISRAISDLEGIIAEVLEEFVPDLAEEMDGRVGVVDGSLCPSWSWADAPELYSGKHKTTGHSHQFVCDLPGDLLHVSEPLPGKTATRPTTRKPSMTSASPTPSARTIPLATKVSSAQDPPPPSANHLVVNCRTGRKNSIQQPTRFAM